MVNQITCALIESINRIIIGVVVDDDENQMWSSKSGK